MGFDMEVELSADPANYVPTVTTIVLVRDRERDSEDGSDVQEHYWQFLNYRKFQSILPRLPELVSRSDTLLTAREVLQNIDVYVQRIVMTEDAYVGTFKALFDAPAVPHLLIAPIKHTCGAE